MNAMQKNIKTLDRNSLNTSFNSEEFADCLHALIETDEILPTLRGIFTSLRAATDSECGVKHVTLEELRSTIDTMNGTFDDGVGVEKSFITEMASGSNDISAMIISPFTNSELWVIQLHTPGYMEQMGIHAINCTCMHESLNDDKPYLVGVIVIDPIKDDNVARQVLWHEVTHYLLSYIKEFIDRETVECIDRIHNCNEFLADFLQFLAFKSVLADGVHDFIQYENKHFDERVKKRYKPFLTAAQTEIANRTL